MSLENIRLEKTDGTTREVKHSGRGKFFEEGTFGRVRESEIVIARQDRQKERSLVEKKFKKEGGAAHAFETYGKMKKAGLKVPPTYRLDRENNRIFMTNYNSGGNVALAATSSNAHAENLAIENILNLDELKKNMIDQCERASKSRIRLPVDSFFFLVPEKSGAAKVDFVLGDLDTIFTDYVRKLNLDEAGCLKANIENANQALQLIIEKYVKNI